MLLLQSYKNETLSQIYPKNTGRKDALGTCLALVQRFIIQICIGAV